MKRLLDRSSGKDDGRGAPAGAGSPGATDTAAGAGTPDVFLSYAREDADFVRTLDAGLKARGKDVWVDWDDIRPSADWWVTIRAGIDAAKTFVVILSPELVSSEICREELEYAVASNKRVVPVLRREVDQADTPRELTAPNWLFCRDGDDVDGFLARLVETLETDLPWLEEHARLLVRAREWEQNGRDRAFLLRGNDLRAAEGWLTRQAEHAETATSLQSEYVVASRRGASRVQRIVFAAVLAALAVALALATFAFLQRNTARDQSRAALAQALAAQSVVDRDTEPDRALLLAVQANRIHRTPRSERTLLAALDARPHLVRFLQGAHSSVNELAFSGDGRLLASANGNANSHDNAVHLWSVPAGVALRRLEGEGLPLTAVALSPGGRLAAAGDEAGRVMLWDIRTGHRAAPVLHLPVDRIRKSIKSLAFSPDGSLLAVGTCAGDDVESVCNQGLLAVFDVRTHRRLLLRAAHTSPITSLAFSDDGTMLASASGGGIFHSITNHDFSVILWAVPTWRRLGGELIRPVRRVQGGISALAFSPNGKKLAAGSYDGTFGIWNVRRHRLETVITGHDASVIALGFSRDGTRVRSAYAGRRDRRQHAFRIRRRSRDQRRRDRKHRERRIQP